MGRRVRGLGSLDWVMRFVQPDSDIRSTGPFGRTMRYDTRSCPLSHLCTARSEALQDFYQLLVARRQGRRLLVLVPVLVPSAASAAAALEVVVQPRGRHGPRRELVLPV